MAYQLQGRLVDRSGAVGNGADDLHDTMKWCAHGVLEVESCLASTSRDLQTYVRGWRRVKSGPFTMQAVPDAPKKRKRARLANKRRRSWQSLVQYLLVQVRRCRCPLLRRLPTRPRVSWP